MWVGASWAGIIPARAGFTDTCGRTPAASSDHPRSRGVYTQHHAANRRTSGSSPLARGLQTASPPDRGLRGIIPARAGFTTRDTVEGVCIGDHPRSRGVYGARSGPSYRPTGSSPLARGLHQGTHDRPSAWRIIPARAGFTRHECVAHHRRGDHPRSRGVYRLARTVSPSWAGSSPLARGLPMVAQLDDRAVGIIPARAGFTDRAVVGRAGGGDHPRSRGVYRSWPGWGSRRCGSSPLARGLRAPWAADRAARRIIPARAGFTTTGGRWEPGEWGSSPLARGLRLCSPVRENPHGIIPARAGFTHLRGLGRARGQDHPRSRGVYVLGPLGLGAFAGSSPLARGLLLDHPPILPSARIIPARAGFTPRCVPRLRKESDHPRSRGVYGRGVSFMRVLRGSSPLARGLLATEWRGREALRIIPARAGFTPNRSRCG